MDPKLFEELQESIAQAGAIERDERPAARRTLVSPQLFVEIVGGMAPEPEGYMVGKQMLADMETEARDWQAEARTPYMHGYTQGILDMLYWLTNRGERPHA